MSNQLTSTDWFSKPGDSMRAAMQRKGKSADDLASHLNGGLQEVRGLMEGSLAIDENTAGALARALGATSTFWLQRQANYEISLERAVSAALPRVDEWLDVVPTPGPARRGQFTEEAMRSELERRLVFFSVPTLDAWQQRYGNVFSDTKFRTSPSFQSSKAATTLWLRRGELEADLAITKPFRESRLREVLPAIRELTRISKPDRFLPKLKVLCAEAGVAVVVVKTPSGCHASGASRMISADKAMMLLSFRHRADDHFWFTVFHELGHLILHGGQTFVDAEDTIVDALEQEANQFAADCILPDSERSQLASLSPDRRSVLSFSKINGISPGLTVGQMQHLKLISHSKLNSLKRRWAWADIDPALV
ncbi:DNA-binding protein [Brevundimonas sp. LM2]|uniref:ImmA/IrrE family metallo-endopeptidase n=1 Tax=Brevundimonas sp. LM2 TaxID=1938605 RepID=UPI000983F2DF|nr:ImmA/IrrE family metallo-endopeptidase [Brevundimonas sp. LM2]AQR60263.1 DNA-binding protein [Brevundimonas sp. LM2]